MTESPDIPTPRSTIAISARVGIPSQMVTQLSIISGQPSRIDTVNEHLDTHLHPRLAATTGSAGIATYTSTDSGITIIESTSWTSPAHGDPLDGRVDEPLEVLRRQAATLGAGSLTEERYEITGGIARATPPRGALVELSRFTRTPGSAGRPLTIFNKATRHRLTTATGLYNVRLLLNRDAGHGIVTAIWRNRQAAQEFWVPAGHPQVQPSHRMGVTFTSIEYHTLTHWKPTNHTPPSTSAPPETITSPPKSSAEIVAPSATRNTRARDTKATREHPIYRDACRDVINYVLH